MPAPSRLPSHGSACSGRKAGDRRDEPEPVARLSTSDSRPSRLTGDRAAGCATAGHAHIAVDRAGAESPPASIDAIRRPIVAAMRLSGSA